MKKIFLFLLISISPLLSNGGSVGHLKKDTDLKEEASISSRTLKTLSRNDRIEVIGLTGGWAKVDSNKVMGYVKIFNIQTQPLNKNSLLNSEFIKTGSKKAIVSTGVKGVSEEHIKNLKPAPELAQALDKFKPNPEEIAVFQNRRKFK